MITNNDKTNYKYNFQQRIFTLKSTHNIWKQRKLSLKGKVTVLNNLALAPIIYVSSVVNIPNKAIMEINITKLYMGGLNFKNCTQNINSTN